MRPAAQVQATIELLDQLNETRYPADRTMAQYFKQRRYIGSKDKAKISEYFYSVLRQRLSLEFLAERADLGTHSRMLMAVNVVLEGGSPAEYFNGEHYSPKPLRPQQLDSLASLDSDLSMAPEHVRLNVPEWIIGKLKSALGDRFETEMIASNQRATTDIRVNTLKSTVQQVQQVLTSMGHDFELTELSPWGIRFRTRVSLFGLDVFKQGWLEVQDQGSQLLALLSGVKAGQKVVDFCAGAGGKTLALAAMMENKGVIYACDVHSKRLEQMTKRSKRAGVHNVRAHLLSSENDKWVKKHKGMADVVLIDAPCTGTGTWRRSPDSRWNLSAEDLTNLQQLQQSILHSTQRLVKPEGTLVYATCSLLVEENEQQVEQFLVDHPDFERVDIELPESLANQQGRFIYNGSEMRTFPGLTGTDGFFISTLRRKPEITTG